MAPQGRKGLIAAAADVVLGNKEVSFLYSVDQSLRLFSLSRAPPHPPGTSCLTQRCVGTLRLSRVHRKVWKAAASSLLELLRGLLLGHIHWRN